MKTIYRKLFYVVFATTLFSCTSIKKSYESRDYDSAINQFTQKKKPSDEEISLFEKAYQNALDRDKEKISTLKTLNNGDRWEEIFDLYSKINTRQNNILRILPLYFSNGNKAIVEISAIGDSLEESRQNAAQVYYDKGVKFLNSGIKSSIRQSLEYFNATKKFYTNFKDINMLTDEATRKGKNYVLVVVEKNPVLQVPISFEQRILDNIKLTQNNEWVSIDYKEKENITYDYIIKLNLYEILVTPDELKEIETEEEKTIEDGWKYVLDSKGNVKKDSSGNDIKVPKYTKITCHVKETRLHKSAQVYGDATIYEAQTKYFIKNAKCKGNSIFDYSYYQIFGDKNALSDITLKKLGNPPVLFPTLPEMIERSKDELIHCYQDFLTTNYNLFTYVK